MAGIVTPGQKALPGPAASAAAFSPASPNKASAAAVVVLLLAPVSSLRFVCLRCSLAFLPRCSFSFFVGGSVPQAVVLLLLRPVPSSPWAYPPVLAEGVPLPLAAGLDPSGNARTPGRRPGGRHPLIPGYHFSPY